MAWAQCALSSSIPPPSTTTKTLILPSISLQKPTKRRKNTLRPKLLKTLTKPYSPSPHLPHIPLQTPKTLVLDENLENPIPNLNEFYPETQHKESIQLIQAPPEAHGIFTKKSALEIVLYVFGLFVVQTVFAVWFLGGLENKEEGKEEKGVKMVNGVGKEGILLGKGENVNVDGDASELERKIGEIKAMAREVRASEAKKVSAENSKVAEIESEENVGKSYIQKEVDGRLSKLEKKLRSEREKLIGSSVGYLNGLDKSKGGKQVGELGGKDEKLVFEKKFKFKGSSKTGGNGKGFGSVKGFGRSNGNETEGVYVGSRSNGSDVLGNVDGGVKGSATKKGNDVDMLKARKKGVGSESSADDLRSGGSEETRHELMKPRESSVLKTQNSTSFTEDVENKPIVKNFREKRPVITSDMWWTSLPYALAILMSRSSENESGLYSLKMNEGSSSYTIAFEDRRDATNFSYILESYFEELGDIRVDVVPLSKEELIDEAKSSSGKVIVVRKGQLKLYAGQPLEDVELALRSFMT